MAYCSTDVIPAQVGIHLAAGTGGSMDSRFRGNDAGAVARACADTTDVIPAKAGIQCSAHDTPVGTPA
jgi:hypothetical protein